MASETYDESLPEFSGPLFRSLRLKIAPSTAGTVCALLASSVRYTHSFHSTLTASKNPRLKNLK